MQEKAAAGSSPGSVRQVWLRCGQPPSPGVHFLVSCLWPVSFSCSLSILEMEWCSRWLQANTCGSKLLQGQEKDGEERDSKESSQQRKRKKRPPPKGLFIPPPPSTAGEPGPAGCHQSRLRSPMFLVDCLLKGLFQCSPYTPPPMLSPIREGSGVYFNTLCSTSTQASPDQLISSMLGE